MSNSTRAVFLDHASLDLGDLDLAPLRQVFGELRKVVTPTRQELVKFTLVVLGFVVVMMAIVYSLDLLFTWVVNVVFGVPR